MGREKLDRTGDKGIDRTTNLLHGAPGCERFFSSASIETATVGSTRPRESRRDRRVESEWSGRTEPRRPRASCDASAASFDETSAICGPAIAMRLEDLSRDDARCVETRCASGSTPIATGASTGRSAATCDASGENFDASCARSGAKPAGSCVRSVASFGARCGTNDETIDATPDRVSCVGTDDLHRPRPARSVVTRNRNA